ncbi:MAG: hypothetical protein SGBAC_006996 [Bacillariaceae sp.]
MSHETSTIKKIDKHQKKAEAFWKSVRLANSKAIQLSRKIETTVKMLMEIEKNKEDPNGKNAVLKLCMDGILTPVLVAVTEGAEKSLATFVSSKKEAQESCSGAQGQSRVVGCQ